MRAVAVLAGAALAAGCSIGPPLAGHPLAGRVWDVRAGAFVAPEQALERAARARYVLLGETHDNPEHHRLQRQALEAIAAHGGPRALAMEQFDSEHQSAIDAARAQGAGAEAIADAGQFDRKGWNWPLYRPLVEFAVEHSWRLIAANLSRSDARLIIAEPARASLPPPEPAVREALERDLVEGHCGQRPDPQRLAGLIEAQRARDARMAERLEASGDGSAVLVAGLGHVRKDVGAPLYLHSRDVVSIGFVEVESSRLDPRDYLAGFASPASFDFLWFTAPHPRADPCTGFSKR